VVTDIQLFLDVEASAVATNRQNAEGMIKTWEDVSRYRRIIEETKPEVVVECGSAFGGSAAWFRGEGLDVVSIDVLDQLEPLNRDKATWITGSSTDPAVVAQVKKLVKGRRTMVVLDSDHHAEHVAEEIRLYAPLVTRGCFLVVEDGIVRWMPGEDYPGPLDAIEAVMPPAGRWQRAVDIEQMYPVTMHPAGWWLRL
jgi:cephalosporin hydroxylase